MRENRETARAGPSSRRRATAMRSGLKARIEPGLRRG
uniref:Uncharacterized protein n=1 Tax=Arundo donax TaxID=35708 RepID=A0A0A9HNK1_ARUDO